MTVKTGRIPACRGQSGPNEGPDRLNFAAAFARLPAAGPISYLSEKFADFETAEIAVKAGANGHLVLSRYTRMSAFHH